MTKTSLFVVLIAMSACKARVNKSAIENATVLGGINSAPIHYWPVGMQKTGTSDGILCRGICERIHSIMNEYEKRTACRIGLKYIPLRTIEITNGLESLRPYLSDQRAEDRPKILSRESTADRKLVEVLDSVFEGVAPDQPDAFKNCMVNDSNSRTLDVTGRNPSKPKIEIKTKDDFIKVFKDAWSRYAGFDGYEVSKSYRSGMKSSTFLIESVLDSKGELVCDLSQGGVIEAIGPVETGFWNNPTSTVRLENVASVDLGKKDITSTVILCPFDSAQKLTVKEIAQNPEDNIFYVRYASSNRRIPIRVIDPGPKTPGYTPCDKDYKGYVRVGPSCAYQSQKVNPDFK